VQTQVFRSIGGRIRQGADRARDEPGPGRRLERDPHARGGGFESDSRLAARSLGSLFLAGATIGLVSLLLPHPPGADVAGLYSNVGIAYLVGLALLFGAAHVRIWMLQAAVAAGALLITRAVILSGEAVSFYSVWFIWIGLYAFYFFSRAVAAGQVALVAVLYALTLARETPSSPVARWLTTVATLIVAGVFIDQLVRRARSQASAAAASARSMAYVAEVAHELAGLSDSAAARPELCRGAARVTDADAGALWEPGGDRSGLHVTASFGNEPALEGLRSAYSQAGASQAFATGNSVTSRDTIGGHEGADSDADASGAGTARLWHPIVHEQRTIAVLQLDWHDPAVLDDPSLIALTDLLAVEVAVTLERVALLHELETIARTDELTGLPNRRAWQEQLPRELTRAARSDESLCVAILDLDHFKRYNDTHGHQTGDRLLKQVAVAWHIELRPTDVLTRYGGEEFALALPACPLEEALLVVERLRTATPEGQSCSAGIARWDGTEVAAELLDRADHALYRAKRRGRDQSAVAELRPSGQPAGQPLML
jgi:diguanylate cyclase (GGDEF)-like protein